MNALDELARRAQRGDQRASAELFRKLTPLIRWRVRRFNGADFDELFQAGSEGFMHALRTWKPGSGSSFKVWMMWWVRAYAGRASSQHLERSGSERPLEVENEEGEALEAFVSDQGIAAEEMTDDLWRRQTKGIIDGMKDRRFAVVLQERMRGLSLQEVANSHRQQLGVKSNGREWVRQLEAKALRKARFLARAC